MNKCVYSLSSFTEVLLTNKNSFHHNGTGSMKLQQPVHCVIAAWVVVHDDCYLLISYGPGMVLRKISLILNNSER